jgi:hypothetical protein
MHASPSDSTWAFFQADAFDIGCSGIVEQDCRFCLSPVIEVTPIGVELVMYLIGVKVEVSFFCNGCCGFFVCHSGFLLFADYQ